MKLKKIFMSCLLLAGVMSASAQEQYPKTVYDHNPYWYVQVQGGAQYTLGEIDFSDLISPNVQVALGRQFTPVFGARLAVNAWQSKAGIDFDGNYWKNPGTAKWNWKYVAPGIDATFNLSNLFCGFNPNRIFNFSVFAGLGANIGWGMLNSDETDFESGSNTNLIGANYVAGRHENTEYAWKGTKVRVFGRAGVAADFKVSDAVSLGLEVNANTLSDRYNGKKANNWDWYFNALAGVKINLGKTYSTRTIEAPKVPEKVIEKVIERVVEKPVPQQVVEPTRAVAQKKEVEETKFRRDIFYLKAGKTWIDKSEYHKVKEVADYMKEHPNCTVEVTGYADRGTGNPKINNNLSQRRAQAVANMLQRNYGIKKDRIKVDYKGDTIQPFAKEIENRVAICIAE